MTRESRNKKIATQNTIRLALKDKGVTVRDIVAMTGYSLVTVNHVIRRKSRSRVVQDVIAALLELDPVHVWGIDYHPTARQLRKTNNLRFDLLRNRYLALVAQTRGDRLRRARYAKSLCLEELAEISGIDVSALSRYETGARRSTRKTCERLAIALGVDPEHLLFGNDKPSLVQPAGPAETDPDRCSGPVSLDPAGSETDNGRQPSTGNASPCSHGGATKNQQATPESIHC